MDLKKFLVTLQLLVLVTVNTSLKLVSGLDVNSCEIFAHPEIKNQQPLLSLSDLDIIYDLNLVLSQNATLQNVNAIRLQPSCKILACSEPKLKGKCSEYSETVQNLVQNVKSLACKCSDVTTGNRVTRNLNIFPRTGCGILYENWHYSGDSKYLHFSGSTEKLEIGTVSSALVKNGCKITLWKHLGEKLLSANLEDSNTFISNYLSENDKEDPERYEWACCHCDADSEKICENAKNVTLLQNQQQKEAEVMDFSQFVKHGRKIIGIGRNYRWKESELTKVLKVPEKPIVFLKPTTSYIVEGEKIQLPESLGTIFYEIELGVVIGKKGKSIPVPDALDHVAGYFLALDMTAKEFLKKSINQSLPWEIAKGFDTACPVSHFIPKHLVADPDNLDLSAFVNGKLTQSDNTKNMIFNVSTLISYISRYMTLQPWDTIITGTPDGLGPAQSGDVIQGVLGNLTKIRFEVVNFKDDV